MTIGGVSIQGSVFANKYSEDTRFATRRMRRDGGGEERNGVRREQRRGEEKGNEGRGEGR